MSNQYELHPLCAAWPPLDDAEQRKLRDDIAEHGVREPITLLDGMILDGRNRYEAATAEYIDFETVDYHGDDPVAFVISRNAHRRHLSARERAAAVARCHKLKAGGRPGKKPAQGEPVKSGPVSRKQIAADAKVSEATAARAVQEVKRERGELPPSPAKPAAPSPKEKLQQEVAAWKTKALNLEEVSKRQKQKLDLLENAAAGKTTQALKTVGGLQGEVSVLKKQVADWQGKYGDEVRARKAIEKRLRSEVRKMQKCLDDMKGDNARLYTESQNKSARIDELELELESTVRAAA